MSNTNIETLKKYITNSRLMSSFFPRPSFAYLIISLFVFTGIFASNALAQPQVVVLTSGNSWVVPANADVSSIVVECWGAGGGGGATTPFPTIVSGGGGGGGAYAKKTFNSFFAGQTIDYVIGNGGSGGSGTHHGGDTWFSANSSAGVKAQGGRGVADNSTTGANGGSIISSFGDVVFAGGKGGDGDVHYDTICTVLASGGGGAAGTPTSNGAVGGDGIVDNTCIVAPVVGVGGSNLLFTPYTSTGGVGVVVSGYYSLAGHSGVRGAGGSGNASVINMMKGGNGGNGLIRITYERLYVAEFVSISSLPTELCVEESTNISITLKNIGSRTWYASGSTDCLNTNLQVAASFKWNGDPDFDQYTQNPYSNRNPLPHDVAPGQTVTITFPIRAPLNNVPGANNLAINLRVQECMWFNPVVYTSPSINIKPLPNIDAGPDKSICTGGNVILNGVNNSMSSSPSYSWSGGPIFSGGTTLTPTVHPAVTTTYTLTAIENGCSSSSDAVVTVGPPPGNPLVFGNNVWNVYGYEGSSTNINSNIYRGYYVQPDLGGGNFGVSTGDYWSANNSPSFAGTTIDNGNLWQGCPVQDNNHTFVHKREGFPCGNYTITMKNWDDETRLFINGNKVWGCTVRNGGSPYANPNGSQYSCPTRVFAVQLDLDSRVEIQTFEASGDAGLTVEIVKNPPSKLTFFPEATRECRVKGSSWVDFYDEKDNLIGSINPHGNDLGVVSMQVLLDEPSHMAACNIPANPLHHTAYMGRRWIMTSSDYPSGANFSSDIVVRLPYTDDNMNDLNKYAETNTPGNPFDGGFSDPANLKNLMLTKITEGNEDGWANQDDCPGTIIGIPNSGFGTNVQSIAHTEYVDFEIGQFSEFFLHKNHINSPLPVTLTSFSTTCDSKVRVRWTTASEQNSDYFVVEKSRDGKEWVFVGEQNAAGYSSKEIHYNQIDLNSWGGVSYYRLRQVDFDGEQTVYGPISVSCAGGENGMNVYPNPNNGAFTIEISSNEVHSDAQLYFTDMTGKVIATQNLNIVAGTTQVLMNDLDLSNGAYLVSLRGVDLQLKPIKVMVNR